MRLFIAIDMPDFYIKNIKKCQDSLKEMTKKISLTKLSNIHLTLKFLGETEEEKLEKIILSLNKISRETKSFSLKTNELGYFKRRGNYLIWHGLEENENLSNLKSKIEYELCKYNFKPEYGRFIPHITIARRAEFKESIDKLKEIKLNEMILEIDGFSLYLSEFTKRGVIYKSLADFYLKRL